MSSHDGNFDPNWGYFPHSQCVPAFSDFPRPPRHLQNSVNFCKSLSKMILQHKKKNPLFESNKYKCRREREQGAVFFSFLPPCERYPKRVGRNFGTA